MTKLNIPLNIRDAIKESSLKHGDHDALSTVSGPPLTYSGMLQKVILLAYSLKETGVSQGDKVAILGKSSPNWGISYLATVFLGAVTVPVLPDFNKAEIKNILEHSEASVLFLSEEFYQKCDASAFEKLTAVISLKDFSVKHAAGEKPFKFHTHVPGNDNPAGNLADLFGPVDEDDLASIIYTSGTTGSSKGVMLTHKNIMSNVRGGSLLQELTPDDRLLSLLPLSHTYECTIGFILPLCHGASITYIDGPPTANVLLPALEKVKPTIILSVPLIIEKIYKAKIKPAFRKGIMKKLYGFPPTRKLLNRLAGKKLLKTFGGHLHFFGIGGAKLDAETEKFLREARFPYAIGYGLTETSPLLAGAAPDKIKYQSTGTALEGLKIKLIDVNEESGIGEIVARGDSVMKGYFKNEQLTMESFTPDGFFRTGDLGFIDEEGYLYIRGRRKNVILRSSGENIYPEDIESIINKHHLVLESIVYEVEGKLTARVHLNYGEIEELFEQLKNTAKIIHEDVESYTHDLLEEIRTHVNEQVNKFSRIAIILEQRDPFVKTPTLKIKKYLYI